MIKIEISDISKYRSELMGIATIGILACHAGARGVALGPFLLVFNMGKVGVPLFFFLSGFGLYFSINKLYFSDGSILKWYKKRLLRIYVPYSIWCVPFFINQIYIYPETDWLNWLYYFSLLSYWDGSGGVAWFLSVLIVLYFVTPLLYKFLMYRNKQQYNLSILVFISIVCYFILPENSTLQILCSNMPNFAVFALGMTMGFYSEKGLKINLNYFFLAGIVAYLMYFFNPNRTESHMLHVGTLLFLIPIVNLLFDYRNKHVYALQWLGNISLESYLTNGALPRVVALIPWGTAIWLNKGNYLSYTIVVIGGLILAWFIHWAGDRILKLIL